MTNDIKDQLQKELLNKGLRLAPSRKAVLMLNKESLIRHNALIFHKGSSLPSTQRKMIQERIAYGINKGTIKTQEVADEINKLNALIQGELIKVTKE